MRLRQVPVRWGRLLAPAVLTVALIAYAFVLFGQLSSDDAVTAVSDVGQLVASGAAAVSCVLAARRSGSARERWSWLLFAGGTGSWAVGQAVWSYIEVIGGRAVPFPSVADVGFLGFPPLCVAALLLLPVGRGIRSGQARNLLDGLVIACSLVAVAWMTSLGAAVHASADNRLAAVLSVGYPVGDVLVLTMLLLVLGHSSSRDRTVLGLLAGGLAAIVIADSAFVYVTSYQSDQLSNFEQLGVGQLADLGWMTGFGLVAMAALRAAEPARSAAAGGAAPGGREPMPAWWRLGLPYVPMTVALGVIFLRLLTRG